MNIIHVISFVIRIILFNGVQLFRRNFFFFFPLFGGTKRDEIIIFNNVSTILVDFAWECKCKVIVDQVIITFGGVEFFDKNI